MRFVPDNDIIPKFVKAIWRKPARLAIGMHPPEEVGDVVRATVARCIREADLAPSAAIAGALHECAVFGNRDSWEAEIRNFVEGSGNQPLAHAIVAEGERLLEGNVQALRLMRPDEVVAGIVGNGLRRHAKDELFGAEAIVKEMLGASEGPISDAFRYQDLVLDNAGIEEIAESTATRRGRDVRAPRSRPKERTQDLLREDLE